MIMGGIRRSSWLLVFCFVYYLVSGNNGECVDSLECVSVPVAVEPDLIIKNVKDNIIVASRVYNNVSLITIWDKQWIVLPQTFQASFWIPDAKQWMNANFINKNDVYLEIGTGNGVFACKAIMDGASFVVATDINDNAIKNVLLNAKLHDISNEELIAIKSDIFNNPLLNKYRFDKIFWHIPCIFINNTDDNNNNNIYNDDIVSSLIGQAVFDPGYNLLKRYFKDAYKYLKKPNGKVYIIFSKDICGGDANEKILFYYAKLYNWDIKLFEEKPITTVFGDSWTEQLWELTPMLQ